MVTQPILERKKISIDQSFGSCLPTFGVRYYPWELHEGGLKNGVKFWPAPVCVLTQFCAGQTDSGCHKST